MVILQYILRLHSVLALVDTLNAVCLLFYTVDAFFIYLYLLITLSDFLLSPYVSAYLARASFRLSIEVSRGRKWKIGNHS